MNKRQNVMEIYIKISKRVEQLKNEIENTQDHELKMLVVELNWVRAELENTEEVNPTKPVDFGQATVAALNRQK